MKRTPLNDRRARLAQKALAMAALGAVLFAAGRFSAPAHPGLEDLVSELRVEVLKQQRELDRLQARNELSVNALAARVAELQAASTRIDALGERLVQLGQLSLDEFDFARPSPVGGPADYESLGPASEVELHDAVAQLSERLRRQSSQLQALQSLMLHRQIEDDFTPNGWPVKKGWISSRFGERNDPFTGQKVDHLGLDFAGSKGSDVLSVASGVVIRAMREHGYGNTVEIDHGNGFRTRYAHNEALVVKAGDHVTAGQTIARMGATGRASAPHLHFEVLKDGRRVNPSQFITR